MQGSFSIFKPFIKFTWTNFTSGIVQLNIKMESVIIVLALGALTSLTSKMPKTLEGASNKKTV